MGQRGALRRLLHERSAVIAGTVLAAIVLACLLAPVYASDIAHTGPDANHITEKIAVSGKLVFLEGFDRKACVFGAVVNEQRYGGKLHRSFEKKMSL